MNINDKHSDKDISVYPLFKRVEPSATVMQIKKGAQLKAHTTTTEDLLLCVDGSARFENVNGVTHIVSSSDCVIIEPIIERWVAVTESSQLVLLK